MVRNNGISSGMCLALRHYCLRILYDHLQYAYFTADNPHKLLKRVKSLKDAKNILHIKVYNRRTNEVIFQKGEIDCIKAARR